MITISKEIFIDGSNPVIDLQGVSEGNYEVVIIRVQIKTSHKICNLA